MIASGLGVVVLAAVLSAFLFITRASISLTDYADMEAQARDTLEMFAQDVRMASSVTWNSVSSVTLGVERSGVVTPVTYTYQASSTADGSANGSFSRSVGTSSPSVLLTGISTFQFSAYSITTGTVPLSDLAAAASVTKQIQIALETQRHRAALALATNKVISARFVLRNKRVTA